ncbi:MAG: Wzy polymerase domain-containing protein, partial [Giesbergeria sp.]
QAMGNLRQRNQQATLLSLGVWALVWWVAQRRPPMPISGIVSRRWPEAATWVAMALLAAGSAATTSRTGLLQWLLLVGLGWLWRRRLGPSALKLLVGGLLLYFLASWVLPLLLWPAAGVQGSGVFARVTASYGCGSRGALWANVLHLITLRPWRGWGWGELDYAHYITLFPGERFCTLLDNAHNLPLHLAVELGLPAALLICSTAAALVWRARPWQEAAAPRQLAWGVLLAIGAHSMLEFPLWYGPFQLAALCALGLLLAPAPRVKIKEKWPVRQCYKALLAIVLIALIGAIAHQYAAVSQLYKPMSERSTALRLGDQGRVVGAPLFDDAARFAHLTTLTVTPANAAEVHAMASDLLHYSPETRVIERLITSAELLGLKDEALFHRLRYAAAYPDDCARWARSRSASASKPAGD